MCWILINDKKFSNVRNRRLVTIGNARRNSEKKEKRLPNIEETAIGTVVALYQNESIKIGFF